MHQFKELLDFLQSIVKRPPILTIAGFALYIYYSKGSIYFNTVEPWLAIVAGLMLSMFVLNTMGKNYKRYFGISCLVSAILIYALVLFLGNFRFYGEDAKIHYKGFQYTQFAVETLSSNDNPPVTPAALIATYQHNEYPFWTGIDLVKAILVILNSLAIGSLWLTLRLELLKNQTNKSEILDE